MEITTRAFAALQNSKRYFTGVPCKHGHVAERFTSSGGCIACGNPLHRTARNTAAARAITIPLDVPPGFTEEHREVLRKWVQTECLPAFLAGCGVSA
jgi:hypothetical protein